MNRKGFDQLVSILLAIAALLMIAILVINHYGGMKEVVGLIAKKLAPGGVSP